MKELSRAVGTRPETCSQRISDASPCSLFSPRSGGSHGPGCPPLHGLGVNGVLILSPHLQRGLLAPRRPQNIPKAHPCCLRKMPFFPQSSPQSLRAAHIALVPSCALA